jgi:hypothetical protein
MDRIGLSTIRADSGIILIILFFHMFASWLFNQLHGHWDSKAPDVIIWLIRPG